MRRSLFTPFILLCAHMRGTIILLLLSISATTHGGLWEKFTEVSIVVLIYGLILTLTT